MDLDEGDIPPLEDMSDELEKLSAKANAAAIKQEHTKPVPKKQVTTATKDTKKPNQDGLFGGFKKGFLLGSAEPSGKKNPPTRKASKQTRDKAPKEPSPQVTSKEDIPHIKPKSKPSGLELPEVQEAMKETFPFLEKSEWVTEDLLSRVENHPNLSKVFQDPNLAQILVEFQKDPQKALAAAKDNKEMRGFLQDFCALMGDHFTQLADEQDTAAGASAKEAAPLITEVNEPSDEDKVRELLAKPEVRQLLEDKEVQTLLHLLKTNPDAAHKMSRSASPPLQKKIRLLIQHGLLAMHP